MRALFLGAVIILVAGPRVAAQDAATKPLCSDHPVVTREIVMKARAAGHGIREEFLSDLNSRPQGREVTTSATAGGGDCPAESTPRGDAAASVGALLYDGQIHCSAVLVSPTMIVTAAHCISGFDENKFEFVLGVDSERPVQRTRVYSAAVHPNYDERHFGVNDIGFIYLSSQVTEAAPVQLPEDVLPRTQNVSLLHVGYGIAGSKPGARRCVNIPVHDKCDDCFSYATKNINTCNGDSGGAAFRDLNDKIVLVGMTDWGDDACADFGIDTDIGYYLDWIQARKSQAPRNMPYAKVENWARKQLAASPDEVALHVGGIGGESKFNSMYKGRWVTWDAKVDDVYPRSDDDIPATCSVLATAGQATVLVLRQYPQGCDLQVNSHIHFTGRLARIEKVGIDVALPEPVTRQPQEVGEAIGEYTLARMTTAVQQVRERRSREVRLESRHGSWSGRATDCVPVAIEAPWQLDRSVPIDFKSEHVDHAGFSDVILNQSDNRFCVSLWAEGYGGTQLFGAIVDAGMVGVVTGTVEYGVIKIDKTAARETVATGPITSSQSLDIPLPGPDRYEVQIKLRDGTEQTFTKSGSLGTLSVDWADGRVALQPKPKSQP